MARPRTDLCEAPVPTSSPTQPPPDPAAGEPAPSQEGSQVDGAHGVVLRHTGTGALVTLHGEVDCADGPALAAVRTLLTSSREHPVVDASAVTFIDAAGLRAVLSLAGEGSALLVLAPSPAFCHLLHLLAVVGSGIRAVPADTGSPPPAPGAFPELPAGSLLVHDRGTAARVTLPGVRA